MQQSGWTAFLNAQFHNPRHLSCQVADLWFLQDLGHTDPFRWVERFWHGLRYSFLGIIETDGAFAPKWLKSASSMLLVLEEPVMPQDGVTFVTICYPLNPLPSLWQMTSYVNKYLVLSWNIHQLNLPRIGSIGAGSLMDRLTYMAPCIKRYIYIYIKTLTRAGDDKTTFCKWLSGFICFVLRFSKLN